MERNLSETPPSEAYRLLSSVVVPRPIAWVTSISKSGLVNAAPFSFFNLLGSDPPVVGVGVGNRKNGTPKDSAANMTARGAWVVNLVDEAATEAMNITAVEFPSDVSEPAAAGLALADFGGLPRIALAPIALWCRLAQAVDIGNNHILLGEVVRVFVQDSLVDEHGTFVPDRINFVGRVHGSAGYIHTGGQRFLLPRLTVADWEAKQRNPMSRRVYLDYAATTPIDPLVRDAMLPYLSGEFGNASSIHQEGQTVRRAIDHARDTVASAIGASGSSEIYFTSGGTEADNTALLGVLLAARSRGRDHLMTTTIEHHAVLDCARFAEDVLGFRVSYAPVDKWGRVCADTLNELITDETALVSIMHANNEIGTINPIADFAALAHAKGAFFHSDAVQTLGQLPLDVSALGVDLLTLSAHKIYGPKGAGALYVRKGVPFAPLLHGGQQEREKRAGTENAPAIVGFGKAVELLPTWRDAKAVRVAGLRDAFVADVQTRLPGTVLNGHPTERLANNANLSFAGADGETLLLSLDWQGIAASSGSACASGSLDPSHVLLGLGLPLPDARAAVRFSLGKHTTKDDLDYCAHVLEGCVRAARV